jgi:hypothetical protein
MTCHTRDGLKSYANHRFPNSSAGTRSLRFLFMLVYRALTHCCSALAAPRFRVIFELLTGAD